MSNRGFQKGHTNSRKYFIDYVSRVRECGSCGATKSFDEFDKDYNAPVGSDRVISICKVCRPYKVGQMARIKKMKLHPHRYYQCEGDDCFHIWNVCYGNLCKKCGSTGERG